MTGTVSFEEFAKIDIRVGRVLEAEHVAGAKRLIKMQIDIGGEVKQSVAGLGEVYAPQDMVSKQVVVVTNLKPRKIFGLDSEVMLLAAVEGNQVSLLKPDKESPAGTKVS